MGGASRKVRSMEERRFFKRVGYDESIRCNIVHDGVSFDAITSSVNISGGGIRVHSPEVLQSPENVSLEIHVPGYMKAIPAHGEIVWMNSAESKEEWLAGIRFTKIDSYDRQMILDFVHFG